MTNYPDIDDAPLPFELYTEEELEQMQIEQEQDDWNAPSHHPQTVIRGSNELLSQPLDQQHASAPTPRTLGACDTLHPCQCFWQVDQMPALRRRASRLSLLMVCAPVHEL